MTIISIVEIIIPLNHSFLFLVDLLPPIHISKETKFKPKQEHTNPTIERLSDYSSVIVIKSTNLVLPFLM